VLVAAIGLILINYGYNSGRFRFFTVAALAVGFLFYRLSIGRLLILLVEPLAFICKYLFLSICDLLYLPLRKFCILIYKFVKKIFSLYIFTLENKIKKLYNIREEVFLSDGVEEDPSEIDKSKRWRYRREKVRMEKNKYFADAKSKVQTIVGAFLVFLLVFALVYFLWSLMQYNDAMEEKAEREEYVSKLKDDIQRLEYMVDAPLDDEFKIRVAREKLGMCFPDEIIFYAEYE
jgi:cell division protein FtsB